MRNRFSIVAASLLIGGSLLMSGCGSSGGSGGGSGGGSSNTGTTSVSGTTGTGTSGSTGSTSSLFVMDAPSKTDGTYGTAKLVVDSNGNNLLDSTDTHYSVAVNSDGSFVFNNVAVDATKEVLAQLTVEKDGFAPVVKTLELKKDTPVSVLAKVDTKHILTQVVKLPTTTATRANTFLEFGITKSSTGIKSFSKLMSLSELQAESNVRLAGTLSTSVIPVAAFDSNVTSVTAQMQAFDSTKKEDIAHFPGEFSGHGKPGMTASATAGNGEVPLESAAFDMIKLSDQNGNDITLQFDQSSKLSSQSDAASCDGMYWTRRVTSAQAKVINNWGDDDNDSSNGFQVPIWSNDNATGTWEYIGEGDWNASQKSFSTCVDKKWEGYLNCDSPISISKPTTICIAATDQNDNPVSGVYVQAQNGNNYNYVYLDNNGTGELGLTDGNLSDNNFTYYGPITGWSDTAIDSNLITDSSTDGCDYDMNLTIDNPYSAQVNVYAEDENNESLSNVYVELYSSNYNEYYYQGAYTNSDGYATFKVKPKVDYIASYKAGTSSIKVDGYTKAPETADSGKYASVVVRDTNVAPQSYIYTYRNNLTTAADSLKFDVYASDANNDPLTLKSITLNGTPLTLGSDYTVEDNYSDDGYLYMSAKLDLNSSTVSAITPQSLAKGKYVLTASVSDGKLSSTSSSSFSVSANHAPQVDAIYLYDNNYNYYFENSAIPVGDYSIDAYAYDVDGDEVTTTAIKVDGNTTSDPIHLTAGDHNITATTSDGTLSTTKIIQIYVGNHAPKITNAGATKYRVDINKGETFKLYAYAQDVDGDDVNVTARDANGTVYAMTRPYGYGTKYVSKSITLTSVPKGNENSFEIIANDGEANSTVATVSVESYAQNQAPVFTKALNSKTVNVNTETTFECSAQDPEGTFVTYSWSLDGQALSETTGSYTTTFTTTGTHTISCTATDADGKTATSSATILVNDPTQSGTLTIHTGLANMKAVLHDSATLKPITETTTDANGDVSFSVTGDRATVSLTQWSGMVMGQKLLMKLVTQDFLPQAQYACENNSSIASECSSADWCTMSKADMIDDWVWDIAASNDDTNTTPPSNQVDTDNNGKVSASELYTAALNNLDKDNSGTITYDEFNGNEKSISTEMFVNVPVREYYIQPSSVMNGYAGQDYYFSACSGTSAFDANLTLHTNTTDTISGSASGSAYGYISGVQPDQNGNVNMPLTVYNPADDGTYSLLVRGKPDSEQNDFFYFVQDKTQADLQAGITLNTSDFQPADKNVTVTTYNTTNESSDFGIDTKYKGLYLSASKNIYVDQNTSREEIYTNNNFTYSLNGWRWLSSQNIWEDQGHRNYYGDGTLKDSYNVADYPMLDAQVTFDKNGSWTLSGNDLAKVNSVTYDLYANGYDSNTSLSYNLHISLNWTVAPTHSPDINITAIVPSDLNQTLQEVLSKTDNQNFSVDTEEVKGLSESQFIDLVAGSASALQISGYDYYPYFDKYGTRYNYTGYNLSSVTAVSASSAQQSMKKHRAKNPFTINFDVSKLFSK